MSVGRWHRRALPRENPQGKRGNVSPSVQSSARASQGLCSCLGMGWGSHRAEEMLCMQRCLLPGCALIVLPCLSSLCATLQPSCIPQGLLMCKPLLEERLWRWGSAEQPCDPSLQLTCSFICCLLLEGSATLCRLRSWNC